MSAEQNTAGPHLFARFIVESWERWLDEKIAENEATLSKQLEEGKTVEANTTLDILQGLMREKLLIDPETRWEGDDLRFLLRLAGLAEAEYRDMVAGK